MSNPYNNEVIFNGRTLMSLKEDTVTSNNVLAGETFHDRSGAPQTGTLITHNVYDGLDSTSSSDALSANMGRLLNSKLSIRSSSLQDALISPSINVIYYNDYFAFISYTSGSRVWSEGDSFGTIPSGMRPVSNFRSTGNMYATNIGVQIRIASDGSVTFDSKTSVEGRISFTAMYAVS